MCESKIMGGGGFDLAKINTGVRKTLFPGQNFYFPVETAFDGKNYSVFWKFVCEML